MCREVPSSQTMKLVDRGGEWRDRIAERGIFGAQRSPRILAVLTVYSCIFRGSRCKSSTIYRTVSTLSSRRMVHRSFSSLHNVGALEENTLPLTDDGFLLEPAISGGVSSIMPGKRILAIGDIHGCIHALEALLRAAEVGKEDTVVVLGDVIDYGRESSEVVERLIQLSSECELICIRGNHEELLLGALQNERIKSQWLNVGGIETLSSYEFCCQDLDVIPQAHLQFLREFRDFYEHDDLIFTHANYEADLPFVDQPPYALRWQLLEAPWPEPHLSGKLVILGHSEQPDREVFDQGHVVCLDTGCRSYGWLTMWNAHTGETWQASKWGAMRERQDELEVKQLRRAKQILTVSLAESHSV